MKITMIVRMLFLSTFFAVSYSSDQQDRFYLNNNDSGYDFDKKEQNKKTKQDIIDNLSCLSLSDHQQGIIVGTVFCPIVADIKIDDTKDKN